MTTETREMSPEVRRKLAGFLHFEDGEGVPSTPPGFEELPEEQRPRYFIRPYSVEAQAKAREWSRAMTLHDKDPENNAKPASFAEFLTSLFAEGEGLVRWENVATPNGKIIPYSKDAVKRMVTSQRLLQWLDTEISAFTTGPVKEEREGLESLPPST